jgi:ethanolamine transporter EutH
MGKRIEYTLPITVVDLAGIHVVALANMGGIVVKGRMAQDVGSAIRNLFTALGHNPSDEALLAVDLFASREDIGGVFDAGRALTDGQKDTRAAEPR